MREFDPSPQIRNDESTSIAPSTDLVTSLEQRASLAATLANPDLTLVRAAATYILYKRRRLSEASERGYRATLDDFTAHHPNAKLADFEPPNGAHLVEDHLAARYGHLAPRTYNKAHSVLSDFFKWHVVRGTLTRDPIAGIEPAKTRPVRRQTFTAAQVLQILEANTDSRDQIALRLLLFFGIRKGALRRIQLDHFDGEKRTVTITTKGGKIQTLQLVDDTIWQLLDELREPGSNYLLPKRVTRRRVPPTRKHLRELEAALASCSAPLASAAVDVQCARELAAVRDTLDVAAARLTVALQVASTQTRLEHAEPIGEHGAHSWWYRCLAKGGIVAEGTTAGRKMHGARHTAIQRVLDKTGNLKAAQDLAGHANISTTGDTYTDWSPKQQADTMRTVLAP